jgi:hypothetical protein
MSVHTITETTTSKTPAVEGCPGSRLLSNAGEMTLRVHAPKHAPREVRIRSPKCTIGSAAGCTLRLRARGVGGLHCWILRGAQGSVVRRLHGSTSLNGAQFDEAPMKIGDRLRIGPVELEIIECNQPPAEQQPVFHPAHEPSEETGELQLKLDESLLQIKRLQAESRQAFQSSITAAERADQLRDALALANDQLEEMYKELAASEQTIDKATTDLEECRRQLAELNACDKQSGVAKEDTRQAVVAAMKECERLNAELTDAIGAANKERESWNKERESWNIERAELQRLIAQQAAELESARSSNVAQTCALTVSLTEKTSENEAAQKQLQAKITDLEEQLTAQQCEIDSLRRQLDEKSAEGSAMTVAFHERSKGDEAARNELQAKLKELEQQLGGKQCEVESLQQRLDEKSAEGSAMTIAFHERSKGDDAAHNELQAKLKNLEQQLGGKQREVESLQQQLDEKSAEGCAMTISLGARSQDDAAARKELETKLADLEEQLATKQRELDSLQQRLDEEAAQGCAMTIALGERSRVDDTGRKEFEAKLTDLEERLTEKQGEIDTLQQRLESHAGVQHKLERLAVEFDSKCRELDNVRGQLTAAGEKNSTVQQELDQQTEALLVREQELLKREVAIADLEKGRAVEQDKLQSERERLQEQKVEQQQAQLDGRAAELEAMSAQTVSRQVELDELRKQLTEEHASIEDQRRQLDKQRQELEKQQKELRAQQEALEQRMADERQMAASPQAPEQPAAPGTATGGAASADAGEAGGVDSVLSRLVKAGLWRGDEPGAAAEAEAPAVTRQIPEPVAERPIAAARHAEGSQTPADADDIAPHPSTDALAPLSTTPGKAGSDEESIESYMERLMQRMRGDEGAQKVAGAPPVAPIAASPTSGTGETAAEPSAAGQEQPIAAEPGEFTPRRAAPEVIADMSAMRDIANTAARSAIDRHVRKHTGQQAAGRLLGACLTVSLSAGLGFWAWKTGSLQAAAGSIIGGGLGLHWLLSAARRLFKLRHLNALQNASAEAVTKPN